ncbi:probable leucine-rich repeat receptor-like protein kinase At5g49770 isoform X2 [Papaver somniferum]|uniref:probable leucine-rich repeat receptor-like protein kinase At5g49770 isoform X2 n=1 Tax=Papaver somniferum TaxID=3469 RepID=UPI000E6F8BF6|nr:probable leucine-rich repeat receptor-like protein kinase At5g49770 isoform X2 [Papaver somniferum]
MCWTAIAVLRSLKENWENSPPNWNTDDPCGDQWDGVGCTGARVTSLELSNMNLKGTLNGDIGVLAELRSLLGLKGIDEAVVPDSQVFVLRNDTVTCASEGLRL